MFVVMFWWLLDVGLSPENWLGPGPPGWESGRGQNTREHHGMLSCWQNTNIMHFITATRYLTAELNCRFLQSPPANHYPAYNLSIYLSKIIPLSSPQYTVILYSLYCELLLRNWGLDDKMYSNKTFCRFNFPGVNILRKFWTNFVNKIS